MFKSKYSRRRGSTSTSASPSTALRPARRGLFSHGVWLCDCKPRLPAERFQVKKEGKNHGRWFYTCQKPQADRCQFFLWDDDAAPRMESAVLAGSTTESPYAAQRRTASHSRGPSPPPLRKRARPPDDHDDDDELGADFALASSDEERLAQLDPATPRKARKVIDLRTPTKARPAPPDASAATVIDLRTPTKPRPPPDDPHTPTPTKVVDLRTPQKHTGPAAATSLPTPEDSRTAAKTAQADASPLPARFRDVPGLGLYIDPKKAAASSSSSSGGGASSLTTQVMHTLWTHDAIITPSADSALRELLDAETRVRAGLLRGRDAARSAVAEREGRIAQLAERVARLECELEGERALVAHLRDEVATTRRA